MNNLINILFRDAIGYETFTRFGELNPQKFPPHNIATIGDDRYNLSLAVAGYSKDELTVTVENGHLLVKGKKHVDNNIKHSATEYLYQGIAFRDFERSWKLGEYVEVEKVVLVDGILSITLERKVPEEKKAKSFDIKTY